MPRAMESCRLFFTLNERKVKKKSPAQELEAKLAENKNEATYTI